MKLYTDIKFSILIGLAGDSGMKLEKLFLISRNQKSANVVSTSAKNLLIVSNTTILILITRLQKLKQPEKLTQME